MIKDMTPDSVVIVDDHPVVRQGIRRLLAVEKEVEIIGGQTAARVPSRWQKSCARML